MPTFDKLPKYQHKKTSSKGGKRKHPNKGFGSLSIEERKLVSKRAAKARWDKK